MDNTINIIGISGCAISGKDTLFKCLSIILKNKNLERYAFADDLKAELNSFTLKQFGISSFTSNPKEKKIIRGFMVQLGETKRDLTGGRYWIDLIKPKILDCIKNNCIPVITDVRHADTNTDEHFFIKKEIGGVLIHITRLDHYNNPILPSNEVEAEDDPKIKEHADYRLIWPTNPDLNFLCQFVSEQLKPLINKINETN